MNTRFRPGTTIVIVIAVCLGAAYSASSQAPSPSPTTSKKESLVTNHARGTFEIKMVAEPTDDKFADTTLFRSSSDKQFHGDLEGASKGQMLGVFTEVKGSAGYVAMEFVNGALHGRRGSFILQHSSTMARGAQRQSITVVPDSGTGQLVGLAGNMIIIITDGKHSYEFDYTLPDTP